MNTTTTEVKAPRTRKPKAEAKPTKRAAKKPAPAKQVKKVDKAQKAEGAAPVTGPQALARYAPNYVHDKENKTAGGHVSVDNGDQLAQKLRGATLDAVYAQAAKVLEESEKDLRTKYAHLNTGMQRMNLGNRMRGVLMAK